MTDKLDIPALSRKFAELAGIEWHRITLNSEYHYLPGVVRQEPKYLCSCGARVHDVLDIPADKHKNPDLTDAREVIRVMKKIGKLADFIAWISKGESYNRIHVCFIEDETGLALFEAVEFLKLKGGKVR